MSDTRSILDKFKNILYSGGEAPPQYEEDPSRDLASVPTDMSAAPGMADLAAAQAQPSAPIPEAAQAQYHSLADEGGGQMSPELRAQLPGPMGLDGKLIGGPSPASAPGSDPSLFDRASGAIGKQVAAGNVGPDMSLGRGTASASKDPAGAKGPSAPPALLDMIKSSQAAPLDTGYGADLNDAALKAEMDRQRRNQFITNLGRADSQIGSSIAGTKKDTSFYDELDKQGAQGSKNILTRREAKDKEQQRKKMMEDMNDDAQMRDPSSDISKAIRESIKAVMPNLNVGNASGKMLKESGMNLATIMQAHIAAEGHKAAAAERKAAREDSLQLRKDKFAQDLKENEQKAAKDFSQFLEKDDKMKMIKKEASALGSVDKLIDEIKAGNTVAAGALGAKMARAMGEVGVLTQEDVARYVRSGAMGRGAADKLSTMMTGKPTKATLEEIQQISNILQERHKTEIQPLYDKYATRLSRIYDIPLEKAYYVMDFPQSEPAKQSASAPAGKTSAPAAKSAPGPGSVVVSKGKRYKVEADGETLTEIKQ